MKKHQESAGIYRALGRAGRAGNYSFQLYIGFTKIRRGFCGYCWRSLRHNTGLIVRHKGKHGRHCSLGLTLSLSFILPQCLDSFSTLIVVRPYTQDYPRFDRISFGAQHYQDIQCHTGQRYREVADIYMIGRG